jgi:hypothetical protein
LEILESALLIRAELGTCHLGGPHPRSTRKPYPFWATDKPLWLSFMYRWAWVYTTDQLMPRPKKQQVPLEMQNCFFT